ncbi:MAG: hypothetical protein A2157_19085 [Deltaproteobacteria bacterium RBG_16_47_11]|nr:MAG: hypothetical protein A2157_19085 [Deltaproteobacteria bacterium RBG_16_47_11]
MEDKSQLLQIPGNWNIPYNYTAGKTASRFLIELRDNQKILGTKCTKCKRVFIPPRSFCESCFIAIGENAWVELGKEGTIEAFTIVPVEFPGAPKPPYAIAYVKVDGADTAIANFLEGVDLTDVRTAGKKIRIGGRAKIKFKDVREARITDFVFEYIG